MKPISDYINKVICGNNIEVIKQIPDNSIDSIITSPPYYQKRNYGDGTEAIYDNNLPCEHDWMSKIQKPRGGKPTETTTVGANKNFEANNRSHDTISYFCSKCNAWKGKLGLEPTPELYIKHLIDIFNESKRVLKSTGCLFVNISDTYQNKSQVGVPEMFVLEMLKKGWIKRNTIIWFKPDAMPDSTSDRFTLDFEYIFFFTKSPDYYFKQQLEPVQESSIERNRYNWNSTQRMHSPNETRGIDNRSAGKLFNSNKRNKRCVWKIPTANSPLPHYAMYPQELITPLIDASCPEYICKKCGKIREKMFAKKDYISKEKEASGKFKDSEVNSCGGREYYMTVQRKYNPDQKLIASIIKSHIKSHEALLDKEFGQHMWPHWVRTDEAGSSLPSPEQYQKLKIILSLPDIYDKEMLETVNVLVDDTRDELEFIGWSDCKCNAGYSQGIVLDPFFGMGTTGLAARSLDMNFIGIDISPEYCKTSESIIKSKYDTENVDDLIDKFFL